MPEVIIPGPMGRLEGKYHHAKRTDAPVALCLHPHPQHGGTMNTKVTYAMFQAFRRQGFSVLRFNFRGVGRSQGQFDRGEGELADAAAALDWLQSFNGGAHSVWVGGFSFGAWIAMQLLMRRPDLDRFLVVAPPANMHDFSFLAPCPSSGLIIQGDQDPVVEPMAVERLAQKLAGQGDLRITRQMIAGADHFFGQHMARLIGTMEGYIPAALRQIEAEKQVEPMGLVRPPDGGAPYDPRQREKAKAEAEAKAETETEDGGAGSGKDAPHRAGTARAESAAK